MQYLFYLLMLRVFLALIYSVSRDTVVSFYLVEKFETCHKYSCEWALASCLINFVGLGFLQPLLTALFITCIKRQKFNFINSGPVDIIRTMYYIHVQELRSACSAFTVDTPQSIQSALQSDNHHHHHHHPPFRCLFQSPY